MKGVLVSGVIHQKVSSNGLSGAIEQLPWSYYARTTLVSHTPSTD